ncbi:MAG: hypothetical protein QOJ20_3616, partial [Mycobacterium sp.]|nr:hypothetical protein [Mycobacterium sp.]
TRVGTAASATQAGRVCVPAGQPPTVEVNPAVHVAWLTGIGFLPAGVQHGVSVAHVAVRCRSEGVRRV